MVSLERFSRQARRMMTFVFLRLMISLSPLSSSCKNFKLHDHGDHLAFSLFGYTDYQYIEQIIFIFGEITAPLLCCQTRFLLPEGGSSSDGEECWWIPVTYTTAKSPYFNKSITSDSWWDGCNQTQHVLQTNTTAEDWIMVNIKASGTQHTR